MIFSLCTIYLIKSTEIPECTAPTLEAAWIFMDLLTGIFDYT